MTADAYKCEYGYPKPCGVPADFSIAGGKYFPVPMYSCCKHVFEMAITGEEPYPVTDAGRLMAKQHWKWKHK